ncbi:MAG: NACHT domain-containing protein [Thermoleophilia bacterium]
MELANGLQSGKRLHPFFGHEDAFIADFPRLQTGLGLYRVELPSRDHIHGLAAFLSPEAKLPLRLLSIEATGSSTTAEQSKDDEVQEPLIKHRPSGYVPNVIVEDTDESEEERSRRIAMAVANAGRRRVRYPDADARLWTEQQVAESPRNVVVGAPGSGKTELIEHLVGLPGPNERSVVIPLREVFSGGADMITRLRRWAAGSNGDEAPSREEIEKGSLHFLLDGLDEVAIPNQERIARMIDELSRALPRHSFTITSRPIPALGVFEPSRWSRLELNPGAVWRQRYLEARGGPSFEKLLSAIQDGSELGELLNLPFFLVQVVEMYERGALGQLDLWGCLGELVSQALVREESEERLPLNADHARLWLQDTALAMGLAGRTSASVGELTKVPLPDGVNADPTEIAEELVQRSMLRRSGERYSFTHRIIGEVLAAEALQRLGPVEPLLGAVVPVRNELVRGIRGDWRVPATFAMLSSQKWREAIKPRDPLGWARAVPPGAEYPERREAALLLWQTYRRWKIWLWEREEPDVLQGVASLTRHLSAGDLGDVIEEIRRCLDDPSPQVQGNAVRVLSRPELRVEGLERELSRVLADDTREPVVRRQAAGAAADLGLHGLLPAVISRAGRSAPNREDVEAQTCAYAISDLARDEDELIAAARELLDVEEARFVLLLRIEEQATPEKRLQFLRDYADVEEHAYGTEKERLLDIIEDLGELGSTEIEQIAEIVGVWEITAEELGDPFAADKAAAVRGLRRGIEKAGGEWWRAAGVLHLFSPEELRVGDVPSEIVEQRRMHIENADSPPPRVRQPRRPQSDAAPSLAQLLAERSERSDLNIMANAHYFSGEAKELEPPLKAELVRRLEQWWDGPLLEAITAKGQGSWTVQHWASAWLWLAPAVAAPLDDERWSELALAEPLYSEQIDWLRSQASAGAVKRALERPIGGRAELWKQLLEAANGYREEALVEVLVAQLHPGPNEEGTVADIARVLARHRRLKELRELSKRNALLGEQLRPYLAQAGDAAAIDAMLAELIADLRGQAHIDRGFQWLGGATVDRFLTGLFEAVSCLEEGRTSPPDGRWELEAALHETIRRIGGEAAIRGYDELLKDERHRFLRLRRDVIVMQELLTMGLEALEEAARAAGVPALPPEPVD